MTTEKKGKLESEASYEVPFPALALKNGRLVEISKSKVKVEIGKSLDGRRTYYRTYPVSPQIPKDELNNLEYNLGKTVVLILMDGEVFWVAEPSEDGYFGDPDLVLKEIRKRK